MNSAAGNPIALAIAPIFVLIAIGWAARASGIVPRDQWVGLNRLAYWIFFPTLLFSIIARADFSAVAAGPFVLAAIGGFSAMGLIVLAIKPLLRGVSGPSYTSLVQGSVRWNGVVLIAAAEPVFGPEGAALAALVFAPVVPLVNILSVGALSLWGEGASPSWRRFAQRLVTNPLILACAAGGLANLAGGVHSGIAVNTLNLLASAALAGGLLGIGAGLDLTALRGRSGLLALSVFLKLAVMPAVLLVMSRLLQLDALSTAVLVAAGATPGAAASYVLARELGGDAELTAGHVTATVLLSAITLPIWITFLTP